VAFSGGPDSTALAAALAPLAVEAGLALELVHLDHRIDTDSAARATRAAEIASELGLPFRLEIRDVPGRRRRGESLEVAARRLRYRVLEEVRATTGATRILTAHQRDDQVETVLLRLQRGSPVESLAGIPERRGAILRPLLEIRRAPIDRFLVDLGLEPIEDPTNRDLSIPRNRVRHQLLPHLRETAPDIDDLLLALARRAEGASLALSRRFRDHHGETSMAEGMPAERLLALPGVLRSRALRWLLERAGARALPSFPAMEAFLSCLSTDDSARLEWADWPDRSDGQAPPAGGSHSRLRLAARDGGGRRLVVLSRIESRPAPFSYTSLIPGEVELPELGLRFRIRRSGVEEWMRLGDPKRAALAVPDGSVIPVATVRSRKPGDRLRPLGGPGERKLKELLIDRKVPAERRDRLPILEIGGRIAWVPGITIDEAFRLRGESECWVAELEPTGPGGNDPSGGPVESVDERKTSR
jgi:tRNA(Ile)-lysidine synthase